MTNQFRRDEEQTAMDLESRWESARAAYVPERAMTLDRGMQMLAAVCAYLTFVVLVTTVVWGAWVLVSPTAAVWAALGFLALGVAAWRWVQD